MPRKILQRLPQTPLHKNDHDLGGLPDVVSAQNLFLHFRKCGRRKKRVVLLV
tara:strand:+ start:913 stop:1068 length:156 start_codon:yes stop_codon:yes gene_type:complete